MKFAFTIFVLAFFHVPSFAGLSGMNEAICRNQAQFVDCFGWTLADCHAEAKKALKTCVRFMPERPAAPESIEEDLSNPNGAGAWGEKYGLCGELVLYNRNRRRVSIECRHYFFDRINEAYLSPRTALFMASLDGQLRKLNFREGGAANMLLQMALVLGPGLLIPFLIAGIRWQTQRPKRFPFGFSLLLILPSLVGAIAGIFLIMVSGVMAKGVFINGDNPSATAGVTLGLSVLVPLYWTGLAIIYWIFKSKTKTPVS